MIKKLIIAFLFLNGLAMGEVTQHNSISEMISLEASEQIELMAENERNAENGVLDDLWYFSSFDIRIRTLVGLSVPLLASFELGPLIEFQWKRKIPSDFVPYTIP